MFINQFKFVSFSLYLAFLCNSLLRVALHVSNSKHQVFPEKKDYTDHVQVSKTCVSNMIHLVLQG